MIKYSDRLEDKVKTLGMRERIIVFMFGLCFLWFAVIGFGDYYSNIQNNSETTFTLSHFQSTSSIFGGTTEEYSEEQIKPGNFYHLLFVNSFFAASVLLISFSLIPNRKRSHRKIKLLIGGIFVIAMTLPWLFLSLSGTITDLWLVIVCLLFIAIGSVFTINSVRK